MVLLISTTKANDRWLVKSVPGGDVNLDDLLWQEIDTGSNQNPPLTLMITGSRPTGGGTEGLLHLWHGDPADTTTTPEQEFKVWIQDGGQSIVDKFDDDGILPEFEIRQGDKAMRMKGTSGGWITNVKTYHTSCEEVTGDILIDGPCQLFVRYEFDIKELDGRYVKKEGGDEMQGPFVIKNNPDISDSREARRLTVLDIKSGTENSSLNLGALNTSVYVGHNQTTFAKPVHVGTIREKNADDGITLESTLHFDSAIDTLMSINPEIGEVQQIDLFGNGQDKILNVNIQGATYKNAIEFESGPSAERGPIFRIDSNKGIKAKNLKAWDTTIGDVADPQISKDAVNLRTAEKMVGDLEQRIRDSLDNLIKENAAGQMKWQIVQFPQTAGTFTSFNSGNSTEADPRNIKDLQVHNTNLSGYPFGWDQLKPGQYVYMTGPMEILVRFRVVGEPENKGTWTSIPVADGFASPDGYTFAQNDEFNVMFREFSGGTANLDDYVTKEEFEEVKNELQAFKDDVNHRLDIMRLFESPFISGTNEAVLFKPSSSSNMPENLQIHGLYYGGSGSPATNRYPANWNSHLRLDPNIIKIDRYGSKVEIPLDYEQEWTGTVSIYEFSSEVVGSRVKLQLVFKNSVGLIRRASGNGIVYIYFGSTSNGHERHAPEFARGDVQGDLENKKVVVVLDLYRIGELGENPAGGNATFEAEEATAEYIEPWEPCGEE